MGPAPGLLAMFVLFIKGFIIGIAVAAPIGPSGLLCLRRSIADGKLVGFMTGLGAALADALMAVIAAFGVKAILLFVSGHKTLFQALGAVVLIGMGVAAMRIAPPTRSKEPLHAPNLLAAVLGTLVLTLANPVTIGSLLIAFSAIGVGMDHQGWQNPTLLVSGVFLGSCFWWLILSHFADWFGRKLHTRLLKTINVITGLILCLVGVYQALCAGLGL